MRSVPLFDSVYEECFADVITPIRKNALVFPRSPSPNSPHNGAELPAQKKRPKRAIEALRARLSRQGASFYEKRRIRAYTPVFRASPQHKKSGHTRKTI
jgi:hypothetical protein